MTANRTRKSSQPRARKATEPKAPEPMDPSVQEQAVPVVDGVADTSAHAPMSDRNCYALSTLVSEVVDLYPEVTHSVDLVERIFGRNVNTVVTFTGWDTEHSGPDGNEPSLPDLLALTAGDHRIAEVTSGPSDDQGDNPWVCVRFHANPVTMDGRATFNLADAYTIAVGGE